MMMFEQRIVRLPVAESDRANLNGLRLVSRKHLFNGSPYLSFRKRQVSPIRT